MRSARLIRSSRKDLLWALFGFVLLQVGLGLAVELWLPQFRDPYYTYRAEQLRQRAAAKPHPFTVLVLGSSRLQDGLNSPLLEQQLTEQLGQPVVVFNFGIPGSGPISNRLYFERLRREGVRPDLVLVEVMPPLFAGRDAHPEAFRFTADRLSLRDMKLLEHYDLPMAAVRREWWQEWLSPWFAHRYTLLGRIAPRLGQGGRFMAGALNFDRSGWHGDIMTEPTPEARQQAIDANWKTFGAQLKDFRLRESSCQALRDLLGECHRDGIPALMLWMPEGTLFRSWYPPAVRQQFEEFLAGVSREQAAPLIDARTWIDDGDFYECHHLLARGARTFTKRLGREVVLPRVQDQTARR